MIENIIPMTTLANLTIGESAEVSNVHGETKVTKRLMEMGVVPGVTIRVVKSAPFGDPIEIRLRGYSLAMRRSEAQTIEVRKSGVETQK
ncbi:ferrous iron transport protein A [soil metagenome]